MVNKESESGFQRTVLTPSNSGLSGLGSTPLILGTPHTRLSPKRLRRGRLCEFLPHLPTLRLSPLPNLPLSLQANLPLSPLLALLLSPLPTLLLSPPSNLPLSPLANLLLSPLLTLLLFPPPNLLLLVPPLPNLLPTRRHQLQPASPREVANGIPVRNTTDSEANGPTDFDRIIFAATGGRKCCK